VREQIFKTLGPRAEQWAGLKLAPTSVYGIRRYRSGALLATHVDRTNTHVISAILNIAQEVLEDWPLYIVVRFIFKKVFELYYFWI
jgi:prolyl 4-hydroxylase